MCIIAELLRNKMVDGYAALPGARFAHPAEANVVTVARNGLMLYKPGSCRVEVELPEAGQSSHQLAWYEKFW